MERASRDLTGVPRSREPQPQPDPEPDPEPSPDPEPDVELEAEPEPELEAAPSAVDDAVVARQRAILDFERQWWKHAGAKEQAIRDRFELSATRYYQLLNALLDEPAALEYDPVTVARLRRLRAPRRRGTGRG